MYKRQAGGVLESAKRTLKDMYGIDSVRAVSVSGLAQVEALLERIKNGEVLYDFVEVMACPGGLSLIHIWANTVWLLAEAIS